MKKCYLCKEETKKPFLAFIYHFALIAPEQFPFIKGTYQAFGLRSVLCLCSPFMDTILNFKSFGKKITLGNGEEL